MLASMNLRVAAFGAEISPQMSIFYEKYSVLFWPIVAEWTEMRGSTAIDGTSHQMYRPVIQPQEIHYSGHRHCHCTHTQVI